MTKNSSYFFSEKKLSANGILSALLGIGSTLVLLFLFGFSFLQKGAAGSWTGAVGFTGIVMSVLGMRYGLLSFHDDSRSYACSKLGTISSSVALVVWFFVVCIGLVNML